MDIYHKQKPGGIMFLSKENDQIESKINNRHFNASERIENLITINNVVFLTENIICFERKIFGT